MTSTFVTRVKTSSLHAKSWFSMNMMNMLPSQLLLKRRLRRRSLARGAGVAALIPRNCQGKNPKWDLLVRLKEMFPHLRMTMLILRRKTRVKVDLLVQISGKVKVMNLQTDKRVRAEKKVKSETVREINITRNIKNTRIETEVETETGTESGTESKTETRREIEIRTKKEIEI